MGKDYSGNNRECVIYGNCNMLPTVSDFMSLAEIQELDAHINLLIAREELKKIDINDVKALQAAKDRVKKAEINFEKAQQKVKQEEKQKQELVREHKQEPEKEQRREMTDDEFKEIDAPFACDYANDRLSAGQDEVGMSGDQEYDTNHKHEPEKDQQPEQVQENPKSA